MKNQREITEEIGRVQIEIDSISELSSRSTYKLRDLEEIERDVAKHKCLLAYNNALIWVIDIKVGQTGS